jgi:hypothetical protein
MLFPGSKKLSACSLQLNKAAALAAKETEKTCSLPATCKQLAAKNGSFAYLA